MNTGIVSFFFELIDKTKHIVLVAESAQQHGFFEAVVGALSAVMLLLVIAIVVIVLMNHRKKTKQDTLVTFTPPFDGAGNVKVA